ncbi:LysR family transcriptional regulator [bacterium]|nr:LysR family transcriptional regulator [bacterium]
MELFQLRSFLKVAQEGSITRAAEGLFITQPAVTAHIQSLEKELGASLFDRTGRGVQLTEAGHALVDYAKKSLAILDECRQVIADLGSCKAGTLIIGAGVTTSIFLLPKWLGIFRKQYPDIDVIVRTGRSREVASMILNREIDLGFVTSPVEHADLRITGLCDESIQLVASPGWSGKGSSIAAHDLSEAPLILFPKNSGFRDYLDRIFANAGITPKVKMESDSLEAIKSFVESGLGVSFLPMSAVEEEIASGTLIALETSCLPNLVRKTSAIYRIDRYLSASARAFLEICKGQ